MRGAVHSSLQSGSPAPLPDCASAPVRSTCCHTQPLSAVTTPSMCNHEGAVFLQHNMPSFKHVVFPGLRIQHAQGDQGSCASQSGPHPKSRLLGNHFAAALARTVKVVKSAVTAVSRPKYCTFTATSRPLKSLALCTCRHATPCTSSPRKTSALLEGGGLWKHQAKHLCEHVCLLGCPRVCINVSWAALRACMIRQYTAESRHQQKQELVTLFSSGSVALQLHRRSAWHDGMRLCTCARDAAALASGSNSANSS